MRRTFGLLERSALAAAFCVLGVGAQAQPSPAAASGPFTGLAGSWSGSGSLTLSSGATERLRCQAAYRVVSEGRTLQQNLNCTSDNYNFQLRTNVENEGGNLTGQWQEASRNVSGTLSGRVSGGQIQASVQGPAFTAGLTMSTQGNRQSVTLRSQGTELSQIAVVLNRAR